jgi:hypothetical protein
VFFCIFASFCRIAMLLFFQSQPCRILQARQNFASPNFCLGSRERFGAEQNQIPEFPHASEVDGGPQGIFIGPEGHQLQANQGHGPHAARQTSVIEVEGPEEEGSFRSVPQQNSVSFCSVSVIRSWYRPLENQWDHSHWV